MSEDDATFETQWFDRMDSIANGFSGLGIIGVDRHESTTPGTGQRFGYRELQRMFQFGRLARRIVERLPNDCLRRGFKVVSPDEPNIFDEDIKRLGLLGKLRTAHVEALKTGGAGIVIITSDLSTLDQPIDLKSLQEVQALHVFNRYELTPDTYSDDLESTDYDEPILYTLQPFAQRAPMRRKMKGKKKQQENVTKVHASRVIRFVGLPVDRINREAYDGWGQPLLEGIWKSYRDVETASSSIATVLHEWKYDIFKVANLLGLLSGPAGEPGTQGNARFVRLLEAMKLSKSIIKAIVIDKDLADYETRTVDFKGPVEAIGVLQQNLSADTEQPLSQLFGQAPKGFSGDDKPGRVNWNNKTRSAQVEIHTPAIERVVELLAVSKVGPTKGLPVESSVLWPSLEEPDDKAKAETRKLTLEGDQIAVDIGALTAPDVSKRHEGAEFNLELQIEATKELEGFEEMEAEADALRADSGPKAMLALIPPREFAERAATFSPLDADEMHVTLVFLGPLDPLQADAQITKIREAVSHRVGLKGAAPVSMSVSGGGTFANGKDLVRLLLVGGMGLAELRASLFWELQEQGLMTQQNHGFIPHMTLEYHDAENPPPAGWESTLHDDGAWPEWIASEVALVVDNEVVARIPIGVRVDGGE